MRIVVVDDDKKILKAFEKVCKNYGEIEINTFDDPHKFLSSTSGSYDIYVIDYVFDTTSDDGITVIKNLLNKSEVSNAIIYLVTRYPDEVSVERFNLLAQRDDVKKNLVKLLLHEKSVEDREKFAEEFIATVVDVYNNLNFTHKQHILTLYEKNGYCFISSDIIDRVFALERKFEEWRKSEKTDVVVIYGEMGVGKTFLSDTFVKVHKRDIKGNVKQVDSGTINESTGLSQLLGYVKGAFTGADKDTEGYISSNTDILILDNFQYFPLQLQRAFLVVIDSGLYTPLGSNKHEVFKGFIILLTNRHPDEMLKKGTIIPDLYDRIKSSIIELPEELKDSDTVNFIKRQLQNKGKKYSDEAISYVVKNIHRTPRNVMHLIEILESMKITQLDILNARYVLQQNERLTQKVLSNNISNNDSSFKTFPGELSRALSYFMNSLSLEIKDFDQLKKAFVFYLKYIEKYETNADISKVSGISPAQISRYLKDEKFKGLFKKIQ